MSGEHVYTAPWIVPVAGGAIRDGAIVVDDEKIVALGSRCQICVEYPEYPHTALDGVLTPPLVNCHIHLELSFLHPPVRPFHGNGMVNWIENLQEEREKSPDLADIIRAARNGISDQAAAGVALLVDIGNNAEVASGLGRIFPEILNVFEVLAPTRERTVAMLGELEVIDAERLISPHAVYSTSARLIAALKQRAIANNQLFSIHVAESVDEIELVRTRSGAFRHFLERRESWDGAMLAGGRHEGVVEYLDSLGVLDDKTLCVHCVHVAEEELRILARKKVKICLCPGSNEYLGTGPAPLEQMLSLHLLPAIGTDSNASNEALDMWREMQILRRNHPSVPPSTIFAMATLGGAAAVGREHQYGTLAKGKRPVFLEIGMDNPAQHGADEIFDILTSGGKPQILRWVRSSQR